MKNTFFPLNLIYYYIQILHLTYFFFEAGNFSLWSKVFCYKHIQNKWEWAEPGHDLANETSETLKHN